MKQHALSLLFLSLKVGMSKAMGQRDFVTDADLVERSSFASSKLSRQAVLEASSPGQ